MQSDEKVLAEIDKVLSQHKVTQAGIKALICDLRAKVESKTRDELIEYLGMGVFEKMSEGEFMSSPRNNLAQLLSKKGYYDLTICAQKGAYSIADKPVEIQNENNNHSNPNT